MIHFSNFVTWTLTAIAGSFLGLYLLPDLALAIGVDVSARAPAAAFSLAVLVLLRPKVAKMAVVSMVKKRLKQGAVQTKP